MKIDSHVLANGLPVYFIPLTDTQAVTVLITAKVGSRYEDEKQAGISHLLEHMFFKGTKKYPTFRELTRELDKIAGSYNAFTNEETTGFYIQTAGENGLPAFELLAQMLLENLLDKKELEKEKGVIVQEMKMYQDMPQRHIFDIYKQNQFGDHPIGRPIIGFEKTVNSVSQLDLKNYLNRFYQPANLIIIVAGKITNNEKYRQSIKKYFGRLKSQPTPQAKPFFAFPKTEQERFYLKRKTDQAHFIVSFPAFARNYIDRPALMVMNSILGAMMSSRLFEEVREKQGLAYSIYSHLDEYKDTGSLTIYSGVEPKKTDQAIAVILRVAEKINQISDEELNRAKENIINGLALEFEDSYNLANIFSEQLIYEGKIKTPAEMIREIKAVSRPAVEKVAQAIFSQEHKITIISP